MGVCWEAAEGESRIVDFERGIGDFDKKCDFYGRIVAEFPRANEFYAKNMIFTVQFYHNSLGQMKFM